ncbi:DUF6503 family protein [Portibacter lacus]|uniref:Uncharacterized protein n=1 Tax=Portibacter lacus TaxID=1099794 RepID=A0AA37WGI1_9BACT|nr:DUF6503 family protein [Portibacter lacus]GLR19873.1 hypothetical protein GCM10007940_44890 [Portibacter lacus]
MKLNFLVIIALSFFVISCNQETPATSDVDTAPEIQNQGHQLIYDMVQKVGDFSQFQDKKNVVYTYTYQTPDGKKDVSTEKYIFENELSYGKYDQHERTLADLEGSIEQGYDGSGYWLRHNGENVDDEAALKRVSFNRPTNYYWFTMMAKLLDPGLIYEYLGERKMEGNDYDVVKVTFDTKDDKPKDIYQLYINKESGIVDQFLFTVAEFGKVEIPLLMKLKYEEVDGILLPTIRKYKASTWDAEVSEEPWILVNWTDIKFNTDITPEDFKN